ncbi:MAG: DUF2007 domain-containing protein [Proteobacteria bacterium]|nr:DUF2007 domain-containing protein [Pseudomonadota bacterium]
MRQVFSSARIENVEGVAKLLRDEGIEVRIENGRGFRSAIRGNFSYRDGASAGPKAEVWVIRSDDQPRARQLLREAGLLDPAPSAQNSFLPSGGHAARAASPKKRSRLQLGLLVLVAVAIAVALNPLRDPGGWDLPAPAPAAQAPTALDPSLLPIATGADAAHRLPTPPALATLLAQRAAAGTPACIRVDGADPAADCPAGATQVRIDRYTTDGSGTGTVEVESIPADGAAPVRERLEVQREGDDWQVLRTL